MRRSAWLIAGTVLCTALWAWQGKDAKAEVALQAALKKEAVDGDLKGAIEQYKKIAQSRDHNVAAKALIRLGECYERLGDAESRKAYERVVREFSDQQDAVTIARARLGRATGMVNRQVWAGPKMGLGGSVSPDGRYVSFVDAGNLALHELSSATDRLLTNNRDVNEHAERSVISRDGKQVAYTWWIGKDGKDRYELRTVGMQPGAVPRKLYSNENDHYVFPLDWSPDGKRVAVWTMQSDNGALGLVSASDGAFQLLKPGWNGPGKCAFSPDGRFLAYDHYAADASRQRDISILSLDGSGDIPAVVDPANDMLMGWSPEGSRLLFTSTRSGASDLWAIAVSNGKPQGSPQLVKSGIGAPSLGVTASGALYYGSMLREVNIQVASIDFATGRLLSAPVNPATDYVGSNSSPDWSPDGKFLAYVSMRDSRPTEGIIVIRSLETGKVRELVPKLTNFAGPQWSPDGRSFVVHGYDAPGHYGVFSIDAQSGESVPLALTKRYPWAHALSTDGKRLYYGAPLNPNADVHDEGFIERDLASGAERTVLRRPGLGVIDLSPDGNWIATVVDDVERTSLALAIVPVAGGQPRELLRVKRPELVHFRAWAPDSASVIFVRQPSSEGDPEWWQAPVEGGEARRLDLNLSSHSGSFRVHRDGHRVAYAVGGNRPSLWVLEKFLPAGGVK